jgi:hypothetical protein
MRRGNRQPADDEDQDKTLVLQRDELDYPIPAPPTDDPTLVHPVAAVAPAIDPPTEALPLTDAAPRRPTAPARPARARALRAAPALVLAAVAALAIALALSAGGGKGGKGGTGGNTSAIVRTDANVRSRPSTGSDVVGSLTTGQHITISCATKSAGDGTWERLAEPQRGRYVASWLVSPAGKPAAC